VKFGGACALRATSDSTRAISVRSRSSAWSCVTALTRRRIRTPRYRLSMNRRPSARMVMPGMRVLAMGSSGGAEEHSRKGTDDRASCSANPSPTRPSTRRERLPSPSHPGAQSSQCPGVSQGGACLHQAEPVQTGVPGLPGLACLCWSRLGPRGGPSLTPACGACLRQAEAVRRGGVSPEAFPASPACAGGGRARERLPSSPLTGPP
jgi:hypothetical protein